jgi:hypothetical protein
MFQTILQEALSRKAVHCVNSGKDIELKTNVLQAIHFTVMVWQQVMHSTIMNCFYQCGYGRERNTEADLDSTENDGAFHEDWIWLGAEAVDFSSYASVDSELATCGISTTDEWCVDCKGGGKVKWKRETNVHLNHS